MKSGPSRPHGVFCVAFGALAAGLASAAPWPQWMGPNRNWHTAERIGTWPPVKKWEKKTGNSDSSPIIAGGRVYVTSLQGKRTAVRCFDADTGNVVWQGSTSGGRYGRYATGDKGQYYGPLSTPACDGERVFTLSVDGDLQCWEAATGAKRWGFNLYERYGMKRRPEVGTKRTGQRDYGYTSSPMLLEDTILVEVGGRRGTVMAFRKSNGEEADAWGTGVAGHSSGPAGPDGRVFLALRHLWIDGKRIPWETSYACNIATPAVSGTRVVCTSAYNIGGTKCFENGVEKWSTRIHETAYSPVIDGKAGNVYLTGRGRCLDLSTGEERWKFGRCSSVIVTGDDRLIVFGDRIQLYASSGEKLGEIEGLTQGWPSGAFGEGKILYKNRSAVVCFSVRSR